MGIFDFFGGIAKSIIGRNDQKKAYEREDNKIQRLVNDAKKAGISPLAALGSQAAGQFAQPISTGDAVGDAISSVGKAFPKNNALETERQQLTNEALKADIRAKNAETQRLLDDATSRTKIASVKNNPGLMIAGTNVLPDARFVDTQKVTDRYGEGADLLYGPRVAAADWTGVTGKSFTRNIYDWLNAHSGELERMLAPKRRRPRSGGGGW